VCAATLFRCVEAIFVRIPKVRGHGRALCFCVITTDCESHRGRGTWNSMDICIRLVCFWQTSERTGSKIQPNMEILHNSVHAWLIFVFATQKTRSRHTNTIPQKNPYSFHFWMNRKQNISKYGNIAQLGSPGVNFLCSLLRGLVLGTRTQFTQKIHTHSTFEPTRSNILPNMEILENSVRPWLILVFSVQRTRFRHTNTIPQKNPYSFHFSKNRKQNAPK
jgi:hypothetical protein